MSSSDAEWNEGFRNLRKYVSENRDANVSVSYVNHDGYKLGLWLLAQKRSGTRLGERKVKLLRQQGVALE